MPELIHLLLVVVILGLIYWAVMQLPIPAPFRVVVQVIFVVILIVLLLGMVGGGYALRM